MAVVASRTFLFIKTWNRVTVSRSDDIEQQAGWNVCGMTQNDKYIDTYVTVKHKAAKQQSTYTDIPQEVQSYSFLDRQKNHWKNTNKLGISIIIFTLWATLHRRFRKPSCSWMFTLSWLLRHTEKSQEWSIKHDAIRLRTGARSCGIEFSRDAQPRLLPLVVYGCMYLLVRVLAVKCRNLNVRRLKNKQTIKRNVWTCSSNRTSSHNSSIKKYTSLPS